MKDVERASSMEVINAVIFGMAQRPSKRVLGDITMFCIEIMIIGIISLTRKFVDIVQKQSKDKQ